jgi:hypothetical protein
MAVVLSVLMLYMGVASIICAIQAGQQGGTANTVMLFSLAIIYGRMFSVLWIMRLLKRSSSVCVQ